jgi:hypothetical protein
MTRLARALNSDNLEHEEFDCDVDVLQAAGFTAIRRNLGMLIVEAKEGAAGEGSHSVARIKDLEQALEPRVRRMAQRWKIRVDVGGVSVKVTQELILDRCSLCQGRGAIPMRYDGQRMVAVADDTDGSSRDVDCHVCLGSGAARRDYHARAKCAGFKEYTKLLSEFWEALLNSCTDAEIGARHQMWRKLRC